MHVPVLAELRDHRLAELRPDPEHLPAARDGVLRVKLDCSRHGTSEYEVNLCGGVARGHDGTYDLGAAYVVRGNPRATTTLRTTACCVACWNPVHEVFVLVDVLDGCLSSVRVDPNQWRTSLEYFKGTLFP
jgi:hypothetical protein